MSWARPLAWPARSNGSSWIIEGRILDLKKIVDQLPKNGQEGLNILLLKLNIGWVMTKVTQTGLSSAREVADAMEELI